MGIFDFLKKVNDDNVDRTTTVRYAEDAWASSNANDNSAQTQPQGPVAGTFRFTVQDVFTITGRGTVVTGIEVFRKMLDTATAGMNVGILVRGVTKDDIGRGDVLER